MQYLFEVITCDPTIYTMDHPDLTLSNFMEWKSPLDYKGVIMFCISFLSLVMNEC